MLSSIPRVSYLFFADDSLVFARAKDVDCVALKHILKLYENTLG